MCMYAPDAVAYMRMRAGAGSRVQVRPRRRARRRPSPPCRHARAATAQAAKPPSAGAQAECRSPCRNIPLTQRLWPTGAKSKAARLALPAERSNAKISTSARALDAELVSARGRALGRSSGRAMRRPSALRGGPSEPQASWSAATEARHSCTDRVRQQSKAKQFRM